MHFVLNLKVSRAGHKPYILLNRTPPVKDLHSDQYSNFAFQITIDKMNNLKKVKSSAR
jgi:hypothetical protein